MTLNSVEKIQIDFIPKNEHILSIDKRCEDILLFTQNVDSKLFVYSFRTKSMLKEISSLGYRIKNAKMCEGSDSILLTPSFSAGQIFLYEKSAKIQSIFPKINYNKGYVQSAHIFEHRIYFVYPNNIIRTDLEGGGYSNIKTSQKDLFIDTCFTHLCSATVLRKNNIYCLDIGKNQDSNTVLPLESGFIPTSVTTVLNQKEELIEPYVLALHKGEFFVIHYYFSL